MADMRTFFTEIAILFKEGADNQLKIEIAHTLRCIISGGKDPAILRADATPWKGDGTKFQIVDIALLQSIVRESAVVEKVVEELTSSVDLFERGTVDFQQTAMSFSRDMADLSLMDNNGAPSEELKDYVDYGLPSPMAGAGPGGEQSPATNNDSAEKLLSATNPSGVLRLKKKEVGYVEQVVQELLGLCTDLSTDPKCCHRMCSLKICDGLVHYLRYIAADNMKDKRVFVLVSLIWTVMEAYLAYGTVLYEKARRAQEEDEVGQGGSLEQSPALDLPEVLDLDQAVAVLHEMLGRYGMEGFRDADKECRNECLAVLTLIADSPSSHPAFYHTGLLNDLIYYACSAEANESLENDSDSDMGSPTKLASWLINHPQTQSSKSRIFATASELDLQFKREAWMLISDLLKDTDPLALDCVAQSPLLFAMLAYVKYDTMGADGGLAGSSSSGSVAGVAGSRSIEQNSNASHNVNATSTAVHQGHGQGHGQGQGQGHGQGYGQGQGHGQIPSDLLSRDSSSTAADNARDHLRLGSVVHWSENAVRDRPPSAGDTSYATGPTVEPFIDHKKSIHLPLKDVLLTGGARESFKSFFSSIPRVQMREMQVLAMMFLAENAWKFSDEFFAIDGPMKVYEIAMHYCTSDYAEHKNVVSYALILLNRLLTSSQRVRALMEQLNAVQLLLFLFETSEDEGTKAQAVRAVALLCSAANPFEEGESACLASPLGPAPNPLVCQAQVRQQGGISFLVHAMKDHVEAKRPIVGLRAGVKVLEKYILDPEDPLLQPLNGDITVYVVAVLDCVAKAVVGNRMSEAAFAKCDGLDLLFEMIEVAPSVLRIQVLRIVSDILENRDLVVHAKLWRSPKTMRSAAQIAAHCWLDEEVRLDGARVPGKGVICNLFTPLSNHLWPVDTVVQVLPGGETNSSASSVTTEVSAKSLAVTRLATAIFQSRFNNNLAKGNVPLDMRNKVLEKDIRGVVASILQLLGVFDSECVLDVDAHNSSMMTDQGGGPEIDELPQSSLNPSMYVHDGRSPLEETHRIHSISASMGFEGRLERNSGTSTPVRGRLERNSGTSTPVRPANSSVQGSPTHNTLSPHHPQHSVGSLRSPGHPSGLVGMSQGLSQHARSGVADESALISAALDGAGPSDTDELAAFERQVVAIARRYAVLREGSWWSDLQDELGREGVKPIEADLSMVQFHMTHYFEAAQTVQMEQMALQDVDERGRKLTEKKFIDSILSMKTQEFKTELLKSQSKAHKTRVNPFTQKK